MTDPYLTLWDEVPDEDTKKSAESDPSIPEGQHRCRILGFECFESKTGDIWMKYTFVVMQGMFAGRTLVRMIAPLGRRQDEQDWRAKQVGWARQDLLRLLGKVPPIMGGLLDPETRSTGPVGVRIHNSIVDVTVRKKADRTNVYIDELIQAAGTSSDDEPGAWPDDSDSPPSDGAPPDYTAGFDAEEDAAKIPF